jgi:arginine exporter protein ArgO
VLAIGVTTLSHRRLQEKEGRWLKLISGAAMVGLGIYLMVTE